MQPKIYWYSCTEYWSRVYCTSIGIGYFVMRRVSAAARYAAVTSWYTAGFYKIILQAEKFGTFGCRYVLWCTSPLWTCTNDHSVCERLHGFYYGCTDSFIRLAVNNGYLKFCVVGDSVTVSYCTVYSHDSTASTVEFDDDSAHSNPLVKTVYFTICLEYWV